MKTILLALFAFSVPLLGQETRIEKVGTSPVEAKFASGGRIRMDLCSSGIDLTGSDEPFVRVSYHPDSDDVKVRLQVTGDRADLRITDCPRNNFRVKIAVPKSSDLYVRMFAGELNLSDVMGDKDVVLHFGRLNMDVGSPAKYGHVEASVNSGAIQADAFNVSKGGLFRSFDQNGPGKFRIHAHVGAGEVDLN